MASVTRRLSDTQTIYDTQARHDTQAGGCLLDGRPSLKTISYRLLAEKRRAERLTISAKHFEKRLQSQGRAAGLAFALRWIERRIV